MGVSLTDELLDAYVNRPLAEKLVARVAPYPSITPNLLTGVSALFGTLAGVGFVYAPAVGSVCLFVSMVVDCSDGQLARLRGGGSLYGRILDGYADYWVAFSVHLGMLISIVQSKATLFGHRLTPLEAFGFVLASGICTALHAGRLDYVKHRYLAHTGAQREAETPADYLEAAARAEGRVERVLLRLFAMYVAAQVGTGASSAKDEARATASSPLRVAEFRRQNDLLLRLWTFAGPTTHMGLLTMAALVHPIYPGTFVVYGLVSLIAMNAFALALRTVELARARRGLESASRDESASGNESASRDESSGSDGAASRNEAASQRTAHGTAARSAKGSVS
jgi:hypothetical protein